MILFRYENKKAVYRIVLLIVVVTGVVYLCHISTRDPRLMKEGNIIVEKIEKFRRSHNRLPNTLEEIGVKEEDGIDALYYSKRDSIHYTVSFPISPEEHKFYYSDSKKWEVGYRDMK